MVEPRQRKAGSQKSDMDKAEVCAVAKLGYKRGFKARYGVGGYSPPRNGDSVRWNPSFRRAIGSLGALAGTLRPHRALAGLAARHALLSAIPSADAILDPLGA
jgi:hypothetical protein